MPVVQQQLKTAKRRCPRNVLFSSDVNPFTATMSFLKTTDKSATFGTLKPFFFFFALASERIFIKITHIVDSRCVIGMENALFAGASVQHSARTFCRLRQCLLVTVKGLRVSW